MFIITVQNSSFQRSETDSKSGLYLEALWLVLNVWSSKFQSRICQIVCLTMMNSAEISTHLHCILTRTINHLNIFGNSWKLVQDNTRLMMLIITILLKYLVSSSVHDKRLLSPLASFQLGPDNPSNYFLNPQNTHCARVRKENYPHIILTHVWEQSWIFNIINPVLMRLVAFKLNLVTNVLLAAVSVYIVLTSLILILQYKSSYWLQNPGWS